VVNNMHPDRNRMLDETVRRLLRRKAYTNLAKIVNKTHAADLSLVFRSITVENQKKLFDMIKDIEQKAIIFVELEESVLNDFIEQFDVKDLAHFISILPSDDIANIIGKIPKEMADSILEKMSNKESEEVEGLLGYGDQTAGSVMNPEFVSVLENMTAKEVIDSFQQEHLNTEVAFYVYVIDEYKRLVGVSSLRQLVVEKPDTMIKEFMATDIFYVQTNMDQEEVAKLVARYDILAVPVIDESHVLVGVVTVDDVIDIFRYEATEDILKMAGAGQEFVETQNVLRSTRIRLPWLFASCIGGILAFFIIGYFEDSLAKYTFLAAFIPVIMGMGGNIGTQSSTIVVRGLATGRFSPQQLWPVVSKELSIGIILGIVYGTLIASVAQFQFDTYAVAISVGLAVLSSMSIAALVGSLVPLIFARIHIDPAVATGPFVTTSIDIISVYFYFTIATVLLQI